MKRPYCKQTICFLIIAFSIVSSSYTLHASQERGIGYDENTEVVLKGSISASSIRAYRGLLTFQLHVGNRTYRVITAPFWFVKRIGLTLVPGAVVQVVGSKFYGCDGQICLLARSIKYLPDGHTVLLRDRSCAPLWQQIRQSDDTECMKIFYHAR